MFQCNLSRIHSNICQLFKVEKKNAIGLARISQHTKQLLAPADGLRHRGAYFIVFSSHQLSAGST